MKHLIILIAAVLTAFAMKKFKKNRIQIIIVFLVCIAFIGGYNTFTGLNRLVPMIRPFNQLFYQPEYLDEGIYADSVLPLIINDRKIYTKDDIKHFEFDMNGEAVWEYVLNDIHYGVNSENILKAFGAETLRDASLNDATITEDIKKDFEILGSANDMYRYSGAVGYGQEEYWNYFHHCFMFNDHASPLKIYLHVTDMDSELVALWQKIPKGYGEDLFIMDKDYYEKNVKH